MECVDRGASLVCLPEYFAYMNHPAIPNGWNEPIHGPTIQAYQKLALDNQCWLSLGGFQESVVNKDSEGNKNDESTKVWNPSKTLD